MDLPQRANAAQLAARNIKMAKGKHPRRTGLAQKDNSSTPSWATPSSETGLFGGSIQAAGTFNFASPSTFKFDTTAFGTVSNQKSDGLQSNISGGFNQNNQNATTLFGAGAAPVDQSASQASSRFPAGQMIPSFGSGGMEKVAKNPGFSFQGGFQAAGSFGGTASLTAPAAPVGYTASTTTTTATATATAPNPLTTIPTTGAASTSAASTSSAPTSIFSFETTSQPASKSNSIFGSTGAVTFGLNNQAPSQPVSNSIFGFQTQASQKQVFTAEKTGGQGFALPQNSQGSSGILESKTGTLEATHTLYGRQDSQATDNKSNLKNPGIAPGNSKSIFGAPQETSMQGSDFKKNLFCSGLGSNNSMMAPKSVETWGKASPAPANAPSSIFSMYSKDEKLQQDSLSKNDSFSKDNKQSTESKNSLFISTAQPTSATNLFGEQSSSNMFSHKRDSSTLPKKSSPLKKFCEVIHPDSPEPNMDNSNEVEPQKFDWSMSNTAAPSFISSAQSDLSASIKNNFSQVPSQKVTSSSVNLIPTENRKLKETNEFGFGFSNGPTNQSGLRVDINDEHSTRSAHSLTTKPASNAEMKLSNNIFGQANLSVSSPYPSVTSLMVRKLLMNQTPNETKTSSSNSSNEPSILSSQTSFLSQNNKKTTPSEVCCANGNENTTMQMIETESSKTFSKISNLQETSKRNKYAPNVLPRNPIFRELALTSQIKDDEIAASLPVGCGEIERQQFFALYRIRALNKAMGKMFSELPVTSDPQIVLDFYMEERRIILDECSSFGRKLKRKFNPEECDYNTTKKKQKQIEVNNSEQGSNKAVVEAPNSPRKRKLDEDESQESQNSDKRNKLTQSETSQGLFKYDDSMLMAERENGSLFIPKMNPSSPSKPPTFTSKSDTPTSLELMPSPAFPSLHSKINSENNAYQNQQKKLSSKEKSSYILANDSSASSNIRESSTANKFRSILDGPSPSNVVSKPTPSTSEKKDIVSSSNESLQLTAYNSIPASPFLSISALSKSINENSSDGNSFPKITTDTNEEKNQKQSGKNYIENKTTREVEPHGYKKCKPSSAIKNEEQAPENHSKKKSQSFESTAQSEEEHLANPFSGFQPLIKETVKFSVDQAKLKPTLSGFKTDTEKNMRASSTSTDNNKKRKVSEPNSDYNRATVLDTDNESESDESEIDQKAEKEDPSYNPDLEISSSVSTPVEKTGVGLFASKSAILSPTSNATFKISSMSSETGILPGNAFGIKDLQKKSENEKERQESKTSRNLFDRVSHLPKESDQSISDEKNVKTPAKKEFSGFQFQSFQENQNQHSNQLWKPGAPIVFAASTTPQASPSFSNSIFNPTKIDSTISENIELNKASEIKYSQLSTNLFDKENSNQIPKTSTLPANNAELKATSEVGWKPNPIFSTLFGNSGTTKPNSTSIEPVFGQPNQTLSLNGQNNGTGSSSLFGNSTESQSLFGNPSMTGTSSFFLSTKSNLETSRSVGSETEKIESGGEEDRDLEAEKDEQLVLTSTGPGEENEEVLHEVRVRALQFVNIKSKGSKDWEIKGVGSLRILKHKENDKCRLLLRSDPSGKIILNRAILGNVDYKSAGKTLKFLSASEDGKGLETWVLQVKTEQYATKLASVLEENKPGL